MEALGQSIDKLENTSRAIHQDLKQQNALFDGLEKDIDDAGNPMTVVMQGLTKLLNSNDGYQIWTIVMLEIVLILLGKLFHLER